MPLGQGGDDVRGGGESAIRTGSPRETASNKGVSASRTSGQSRRTAAENVRMAIRQYPRIAIVVAQDTVRTQADEHRLVGGEQDTDKRFQRLGPSRRHAPRRARPIMGALRRSHLSTAGQDCEIQRKPQAAERLGQYRVVGRR